MWCDVGEPTIELQTSSQHYSLWKVVLLTVFRYAVFRFVLAEKTKSANIWEPVFENVIILGFLMADTSSKQ